MAAVEHETYSLYNPKIPLQKHQFFHFPRKHPRVLLPSAALLNVLARQIEDRGQRPKEVIRPNMKFRAVLLHIPSSCQMGDKIFFKKK